MTTILLAIAAVLGVTVPDVPSAQNGCNGGWAVDDECAD